MKIHITNSYGLNNEIEARQHMFAETAHKLGFCEMGIAVYPSEEDTYNERSARLDGIIAAVEYDDLIIVQLPTGNGIDFEAVLIDKLVAYSRQRVLVLWHDSLYREEHRERIIGYIGKEMSVVSTQQYQELNCQRMMLDMVTQTQKEAHPYMQADEGEATDDGSVHIGFGLYDKYGTYSVWVGTAMQSVIENTDSAVTFHILHDDTLTNDNRQKLIQVAKSGGQKIQFHHFDSKVFANTEEMVRHFTIGSMFRLLLPKVLPKLSRIIYLDADLFVNGDIKKLWDTDINKYCLAAVRDYGVLMHIEKAYPVEQGQVEVDQYFNTGVLYINLDRVRACGSLLEKVLGYLEDNKGAMYPDQDAFNVIFKGNCYYLDSKWNCFVSSIKENQNIKENYIYHYAGRVFRLSKVDSIDLKYFEILERTPWEKTEGVCLLNDSFGRLTDRADQHEKLLKRITEKKRTLVFYGPKNYSMCNMMNLLHANDTYSIWLQQMNSSVLENKDEYTILVLPEAEDGHGMKILEQHGWKNGMDYFVIPRILPVVEGGYL